MPSRMPQMSYEFDHRFPIAVVRLTGDLTAADAAAVRSGLVEALVEEPTALIIDLAGLMTLEPVAAQVFVGLAGRAALWPGTSVLLCAPVPQVAAALADVDAGELRVYASFTDALAVATDDEVPLRVQRHLEPSIHAPRLARELAAAACRSWQVPECAVAAEILASELVTNAVRHAATALTLRLTLHRGHLRVSVHDRDRQMARLQTPSESDDHGRGLLIVNSVASRWGSEPVEGGKVVWAAMPAAPRAAAPDLVDAER